MRIPPTVFCSSSWAVLSTTVLLIYCIAHVGQCHSRKNNKKTQIQTNDRSVRVRMCVLQLFFIPLLSRSEQSHFYSTQSSWPPRPALPSPPLINITSFQSSVCGHAQRGPPASTDTGGGGGGGGGGEKVRRKNIGWPPRFHAAAQNQMCSGARGGRRAGGWQIKTAKIEKTTKE